jgi:uncharacterized membrane protein YGL010W
VRAAEATFAHRDAARVTRGATMRSVDDWFSHYGDDHRHPLNRAIHWICVPAILWAVVAALWLVPVSPSIGRPGFWCGLAMVGAFAFYWRLSRPLGAAMLLVFVLFGFATEGLYRTLGPQHLLALAIGVFVLAWIGQFIGHRIEGRRPSFLTDLAYLLIGPAWLAGKVMRRFGLRV